MMPIISPKIGFIKVPCVVKSGKEDSLFYHECQGFVFMKSFMLDKNKKLFVWMDSNMTLKGIKCGNY